MSDPRYVRLLKLFICLSIIGAIGYGTYECRLYQANEKNRISYTTFIDKVNAGDILKVMTEGDAVTAVGKSGAKFLFFRPADAELSKLLVAKHIDFSSKPVASQSGWIEFVFFVVVMIPVLLLMKRLAVFSRSTAKLADGAGPKTLFSDAAGAEEAKAELLETVEFLREPAKFSRLGGKMPSGVLLVGPPGTGKTLLARAVAGEAGVPFFSMSGSEFVEMYVGIGASRVRDLFTRAKKASPCIIFIDELDAVGRRRDSGSSGSSDERNQTLNQLLVEMDGFARNAGIVVIAATNRPEVLDPALLRPGRFDRQVVVGSPDIRGRQEILNVHTREIPLSAEVDLLVIARGTPGLSGADLANLVNEAAILAARSNRHAVGMADFDAAKDKVLMGTEKKSMVLSEKSKESTAYHEAGHVMVAKLVPGCDPVHKVSIIPRGRALGVTVQIPEEDIHSYTKEMLVGHIKVLMGGRAAEELVFKTTTTGAGNDLARATEMARKMVCEWGMSEAFGPVAFGNHESTGSSEESACKKFSDATAMEIDSEIRSIVTSAYAEVSTLLQTNMATLKSLAGGLIAKETLNSSEINALLQLNQPEEISKPLQGTA